MLEDLFVPTPREVLDLIKRNLLQEVARILNNADTLPLTIILRNPPEEAVSFVMRALGNKGWKVERIAPENCPEDKVLLTLDFKTEDSSGGLKL